MKYFLNILFVVILSVSILPLYSLNNRSGEGYFSNKKEYKQCHCDIHKISKNNKLSYILDCNNNDKYIISSTAQLRTSVSTNNKTIHNSPCLEFSYIPFTTTISERSLSTDTPPPKTI